MKQTLLEITQEILSDMDSENVNSITDTVEANQIAQIVKRAYYNIVSTRVIPEHGELLKLTAASDSDYPTHFYYPDHVKKIDKVWYQNSEGIYREVKWLDPLDFLCKTDTHSEDYVSVADKNGGTSLRIHTKKNPTYYTSFDDNWIVMDSFDDTLDTTLQTSKVRAYGMKIPQFSIEDDFVPDLDDELFPYFVNEAKSTAMSLLKGGSDPKVEQAARRQKSFMQNDMYKTARKRPLSNYGRR